MKLFDVNAGKRIQEPARDIKIIRKADVLVVGGGPVGTAAANVLDAGVKPRAIDYTILKKRLLDQGAYVPL